MNLKGVHLTWLGHATFRIVTPGGRTIIIDPWIMNNPACPPSEKKVKSVDVLLVTHGHGDHIGDAVEVIRQHSPQIVAIPEMCGWLEKKGAKQTSMMNKGGTQKVGDIKVTMVHADHSCGIQDGDQLIYGGEAVGYVVEFENGVTVSAPISTLDEFAFLEKPPSDAELADVAIWGGGHYVFFPRIDVSLYGLHLMPAHCKEKHDH